MQTITTIGLDIAKSVFQVHGVDVAGQVVVHRASPVAASTPAKSSTPSSSRTSAQSKGGRQTLSAFGRWCTKRYFRCA